MRVLLAFPLLVVLLTPPAVAEPIPESPGAADGAAYVGAPATDAALAVRDTR